MAAGKGFIDDEIHKDGAVSQERMEIKTCVDGESCIGLNALSRSSMKLLICDVLKLKTKTLKNPRKTELLTYLDHVVHRVEIMGIVVRVDMRHRRRSYAVDDGTGVVQCTSWINQNCAPSHIKIERSALPPSLQSKLDQLEALQEEQTETGFRIGDLVLVRGSVKSYNGWPEIDVLDIRKVDNLCLEYERAMYLPRLYEIYKQPPQLPASMAQALNSQGQGGFNEQAVKHALIKDLLGFSGSKVNVFTVADALAWPSVKQLIQQETNKEPNASKVPEKSQPDQLNDIVRDVLSGLQTSQVCVIQHQLQHTSTNNATDPTTIVYEAITAESPFSKLVLMLLNEACANTQSNSDRGCHVLHLLDLMKGQRRNRDDQIAVYQSCVTETHLTFALTCLEANSDVIDAGCKRFLPVG